MSYKISIGILTYNTPLTLRYTLTTYKGSKFLSVSDDIFVVIQMSEKQKEEEAICNEFGIRSILLSDNGMMGSGFRAIYENAKYDTILFLENDFVARLKMAQITDFLDNALVFLETYDIVRCRSRNKPGVPLFTQSAFGHLPPEECLEKYSTHLVDCYHWIDKVEEKFPDIFIPVIPASGSSQWYEISSKYCNYTNNPYICKKDFFEKAILPYCKHGSLIEEVLTSIWTNQSYRCIIGDGLFTHDRKYDGAEKYYA